MGMEWTREQKQVISARGENLLVSAAAGSGKTAVLVERILSLITDEEHPVDIDRLLVVTFTNAAAAEMKDRIGAAIEKKLSADPENEHLQRQSVLLPGARISTIDSFCQYVIQNYSHKTDMDPKSRVGDEGELKLLRSDVAEEMLEEHYADPDPEFVRFVESFSRGKDDSNLEEKIIQVYHFASASPDPDEWLDMALDGYRVTTRQDLEKAPWMGDLLGRSAALVKDSCRTVEEAIRLASAPDGPDQYLPMLKEDLENLTRISRCRTYEEFYEAFQSFAFPGLRGKKGTDVDPEMKERVKTLRDSVKGAVNSVKESFSLSGEEVVRQLASIRPLAEELVRLTREFGQRYAEKKRENNLIDFSDMEHYALKILLEKTDDGWRRTDAARELSSRYAEVMCDEYQDSNLLQEFLLEAVSGTEEGRNDRFMVGDIKQSIYSFRMARPDIFMEKYRSCRPAGEAAGTGEDRAGVRISLSRNFRSRREVIDPVNSLFRRLMRPDLGGILYDDEAALYPGADYPETEQTSPGAFSDTAELLILDRSAEAFKEDHDKDTMIEAEAMLAVREIRRLIRDGKVFDRETGAMRPASYRDIVILMRSITGRAQIYERVLTAAGIPAHATTSKGYFSAVEVVAVLNYLRILDNPRQEIPFAAVLRSPACGLTDREMAFLRSRNQEVPYYEAVLAYYDSFCCDRKDPDGKHVKKDLDPDRVRDLPPEEQEILRKLRRFLDTWTELRRSVPLVSVHELIERILQETGCGVYAAAMPAGEQREANLKFLVQKAVEFEKTSYHGLFQFIRYIERMQQYSVDFGEASPEGEAGNTVRILSIHKSKGLEFPFVILAGLGSGFNDTDSRSEISLHAISGIGLNEIDPEMRTRRTSVINRSIHQTIHCDMLGEEMRILYVAMTRAREKLIMTGVCSDGEKLARELYSGNSQEPVSYSKRAGASSSLDWIVAALSPDSGVRVSIVDPEDIGIGDVSDEKMRSEDLKCIRRSVSGGNGADPETIDFLQERKKFVYPWTGMAKLPAKLSVSEIKMRAIAETEEETGEALFEEEPVIPLIPDFMRETAKGEEEDTKGSGAARGTAYHQVLRELDFESADSEEAVRSQMDSMVKKGILSAADASLVRPSVILRFVRSDIGKRMRRAEQAKELRREQPFVIDIPASEIDPEYGSEEAILVQGVIDAYFKDHGKYVIVDYKTDRIRERDGSDLIRRYRTQLLYYRRALEQILEEPVSEMILYSTALGKALRIEE